MTTDALTVRPSPLLSTRTVKLILHALLSGAFLVAYFSGDEDTYAMHLAAGYLTLVVLTARTGAGLTASAGHLLHLPQPGRLADLVRRPWSAGPWLTALLLAGIAAACISGVFADQLPRSLVGHLHGGLGEIAMNLALAHILFVSALWLRGRLKR